MKLRCNLREIRGRRSIASLSEAIGINRGTLSAIERGKLLPADAHVFKIEEAYGAPLEEWYPSRVLVAIEPDDGTP